MGSNLAPGCRPSRAHRGSSAGLSTESSSSRQQLLADRAALHPSDAAPDLVEDALRQVERGEATSEDAAGVEPDLAMRLEPHLAKRRVPENDGLREAVLRREELLANPQEIARLLTVERPPRAHSCVHEEVRPVLVVKAKRPAQELEMRGRKAAPDLVRGRRAASAR